MASLYDITRSFEDATAANAAFDEAVKAFLFDWINRGTPGKVIHPETAETVDELMPYGALRVFFKHVPNAMDQLLLDPTIAAHLMRPVEQVHFTGDAYQPLFSDLERRIYNMAMQRDQNPIPFRYSSDSRQDVHGDTIAHHRHDPEKRPVEDIGTYFGTRRSDEIALNLFAQELRDEAAKPGGLPVHVVTEKFLPDFLRIARERTEAMQAEGVTGPQCFVIQRRHGDPEEHGKRDMHLSAMLLVMDPAHPETPLRIVAADTVKRHNLDQPPYWWDKFKQKVDAVFPVEDGAPTSDWMEDGGVLLQREHKNRQDQWEPVRHQDIDCAFYTRAVAKAWIILAKTRSDLILHGAMPEIMSEATGLMPIYYDAPNEAKTDREVRQANIRQRWDTGTEALRAIHREALIHQPAPEADPTPATTKRNWIKSARFSRLDSAHQTTPGSRPGNVGFGVYVQERPERSIAHSGHGFAK